VKISINSFKSNKRYISEADCFLMRFDQQQTKKSKSQQKEIEEYQDLFSKRDIKISASGS
jgi:succinate dehydrogenase flavin-adding protein (antitoxin of CptAB toxin-antitoxin module)